MTFGHYFGLLSMEHALSVSFFSRGLKLGKLRCDLSAVLRIEELLGIPVSWAPRARKDHHRMGKYGKDLHGNIPTPLFPMAISFF